MSVYMSKMYYDEYAKKIELTEKQYGIKCWLYQSLNIVVQTNILSTTKRQLKNLEIAQ